MYSNNVVKMVNTEKFSVDTYNSQFKLMQYTRKHYKYKEDIKKKITTSHERCIGKSQIFLWAKREQGFPGLDFKPLLSLKSLDLKLSRVSLCEVTWYICKVFSRNMPNEVQVELRATCRG